MTKIENMRKLEDSSYRFIFKIINNLRKRKHRKQTKIIQENFPRTERHEFPGGKDFPGASTADSQQDISSRNFRTVMRDRRKVGKENREEKLIENKHVFCKGAGR